MPDDPNTPVATTAPEAPPTPIGPTTEELMAALQQERQRAEQIARERDMARQQAEMAWTSRPTAPAPSPGEDPTRSIFNDAITNPDAAAQGLRNYVASQAEEAARRAARDMQGQTAQLLEAQRSQLMMQNAIDRYPELSDPKRAPQFIGEVAKVKAIYEAQGIPQPPNVYMAKAAEALRQSQPRGNAPATPAAYVEGGGVGSLGANPAAPPPSVPQLNPLEKVYRMPAGSIIDPPSGDEVFEEVKKFVTAENAEREKHQVMPAYSEVMVRE